MGVGVAGFAPAQSQRLWARLAKKIGVWKTREGAGNTEEGCALDPPGLGEFASQPGLELISRPPWYVWDNYVQPACGQHRPVLSGLS